jgi:glycine/D-amino acid oxidase-like deaminating enzyme
MSVLVDDVVIVGGGLAGLFCALKLAPRPVTIVITRRPWGWAPRLPGRRAASPLPSPRATRGRRTWPTRLRPVRGWSMKTWPGSW